MAFFSKVASGALITAGVTYYYHIDIRATSQQLSRDLHALSEQLLASTAVIPSQRNEKVYPKPVPARVGLTESIKARWNETLERGVTNDRSNGGVIANLRDGYLFLRERYLPAAEQSPTSVEKSRRQV